MKKIKITVVRKVCHRDLIERYENPIDHACDMREGQVFVADGWQRPDGLCESAWQTISPFVMTLAHGGTDLYDGWMKNPASAMISCNDGFRSVSYLRLAKENDMLSSILIIYTGGTIGMKTDPATGVLVPFDFRGIYDEFPAIRSLQVRIDVQSLTPVIDSSNVTPALWLHLAELIRDNYARYDGFVVLHGTDTMSYTASALSFLLENLAKPVVFTGSQIPIGVLRTDGRENLITAIEIAAAHDAEGPLVPEVSLYFQNRLFRANRTVKQSAEEFAAFRSYNYPALAEVGVNITFHRDYIHRPAHADAELRVAAALDDRVLVIRLFPGLREQVLRAMLSIEGLRAVVLETYGAGNAPTAPEFIRAVREAVARGLLVMNVTQCSGGRVAMELYETGRQLQEAGVICGHDITTEAAIAKLMYVLGQNLPAERTQRLLRHALRGEFTDAGIA